MEAIFTGLFIGVTLMLIGVTVSIRKSYSFRCLKIRKELKNGKRKWYLTSIQNGLVFAVLPLRNPKSLEFGKLDDRMVLLDLKNLTDLIRYQRKRISNICFVEDILLRTEMKIEKYEPAIIK